MICQVYEPDPAAVGQQVADVAREMARRGWRVVVYTSARGYDDPRIRYACRENRDGVSIRRLPLSSFGKRSLLLRLAAQAVFLTQAVICGLWTQGLRAVMVSTSPPFAGFGAGIIAALRSVPLIWWVMDMNPDQIIAAGCMTEKSLLVRVFRWMNRFTVARAAAIITLDDCMAKRLQSQIGKPISVDIIPPWAKTQVGAVPVEESLGFRQAHGLADAFVVMYSGNHAIQHPLTTLLDAASTMERERTMTFVFIGGGAGKAVVESRIAGGATNVTSLPFQPLESLRTSLGAADLHVVSMGDDVVGIVHPCKVYGAMAVGRPILFFGPSASPVGKLVAEEHIGWVVEHGDVSSAVRALSTAGAMAAEDLRRMGDKAAAVARLRFSPELLRDAVCDRVESVACEV